MNIALLQQIKQAILEEPLRLRMEDWVSGPSLTNKRPACDTVGCIFGWAVALDRLNHGLVSLKNGENLLAGFWGSFFEDGRDLLDLTEKQATRLAFVGFWPSEFKAAEYAEMTESDGPNPVVVRRWSARDNPQPGVVSKFSMAAWPVAHGLRPQTRKYAELVARRIDHFIATDGRE